jgi:hypothetical protein
VDLAVSDRKYFHPVIVPLMRFDGPVISLSSAVGVVVDTLPPDAEDEKIFSAVVKLSGDPKSPEAV